MIVFILVFTALVHIPYSSVQEESTQLSSMELGWFISCKFFSSIVNVLGSIINVGYIKCWCVVSCSITVSSDSIISEHIGIQSSSIHSESIPCPVIINSALGIVLTVLLLDHHILLPPWSR